MAVTSVCCTSRVKSLSGRRLPKPASFPSIYWREGLQIHVLMKIGLNKVTHDPGRVTPTP